MRENDKGHPERGDGASPDSNPPSERLGASPSSSRLGASSRFGVVGSNRATLPPPSAPPPSKTSGPLSMRSPGLAAPSSMRASVLPPPPGRGSVLPPGSTRGQQGTPPSARQAP